MDNTQLTIEMYKNNIGIDKISKILKLPIADIYKCLRENSILRNNIVQRNQQICSLYEQQIKKIFEFLYKDATVFLERKYNKFNTLLSS